MFSYPLEWQNPLDANRYDQIPQTARLRIETLWTRAPTVFQCRNVVQVPSKSKTLPDAGVHRALLFNLAEWNALCFGALIYVASGRPQTFLRKPVASLRAGAKACVWLHVPTLRSYGEAGCATQGVCQVARFVIRIRPMTLRVLGWEKNGFENAFRKCASHSKSRQQRSSADVCNDNRPTFFRKQNDLYSFTSNRRYVYI